VEKKEKRNKENQISKVPLLGYHDQEKISGDEEASYQFPCGLGWRADLPKKVQACPKQKQHQPPKDYGKKISVGLPEIKLTVMRKFFPVEPLVMLPGLKVDDPRYR